MIRSWNCLLLAFAYSFNKSPNELIEIIGHDGSEISWPNLPDPLCRRAFHPQEFIRAGLAIGFAVLGIEKQSYQQPTIQVEPKVMEFEPLLPYYLKNSNGVLTGTCLTRNVRHAISWKNGSVYDPINVCKNVDDFDTEVFWLIKKIG